jgi:hypothetical protein
VVAVVSPGCKREMGSDAVEFSGIPLLPFVRLSCGIAVGLCLVGIVGMCVGGVVWIYVHTLCLPLTMYASLSLWRLVPSRSLGL